MQSVEREDESDRSERCEKEEEERGESVIKTTSDAVENWTTRQGDGGRGFKA